MKQKIVIFLIFSCCLPAVGCVALVSGTGPGDAIYKYMETRITRSHPAKFSKTSRACVDTLKSLELMITEELSNGDQSTIKARCNDGTPITIDIVMISPEITEVSIRSGILGIWDKKVSELIHGSIAQRLQE